MAVVGILETCDAFRYIVGATQVRQLCMRKLDMPVMTVFIFQDISVARLRLIDVLDFVVLTIDLLVLFDLETDDLKLGQPRTSHGPVARTDTCRMVANVRYNKDRGVFVKHRLKWWSG